MPCGRSDRLGGPTSRSCVNLVIGMPAARESPRGREGHGAGQAEHGLGVGEHPTTSVRRFTSSLSRSSGLVDPIFLPCAGGRSVEAIRSGTVPRSTAPSFGYLIGRLLCMEFLF